MTKIKSPAKRTSSGVKTGSEHDKIPGKGKKGFVQSDGKFVDRKTAAKVADKADQIKGGKKIKYLHSNNLKK